MAKTFALTAFFCIFGLLGFGPRLLWGQDANYVPKVVWEKEPNSADKTSPKGEDTANKNNSEQLHQEDIAKQLAKLKDPFIAKIPIPQRAVTPKQEAPRPATPATPPRQQDQIKKPSYPISGLLWDTNRPQAILNGKIVGIGDTIDQWRITNISKEGVEVSFDDKKFLIEPQGAQYAK